MSTVRHSPVERAQSLSPFLGAFGRFQRQPKDALKSLVFLFLLAGLANAEELPLRKYTTTDGLPSNAVNCVRRDSRGFLWFCTAEGLSRFDGTNFVNYGIDQGLPDRSVTDFLQTRNGDYWVGTYRGLARFNPNPTATSGLFTVFLHETDENSQHVNSLFQDRDGTIWVATDGGAYYLTESEGKYAVHFLPPGPLVEQKPSDFIGQDQDGNLWITYGRDEGGYLYERKPDGKVEYLTDPFLQHNRIVSLFIDRQNRIWLGTYKGLGLLAAHPTPTKLISRVFGKKDGLRDELVGGFYETNDGRLWATGGGLVEVIGDGEKVHFKMFASSGKVVGAISEVDSNGNFWMGSERMAAHGFVSYGREDGLRTEDIRSIFEGQDGQLYVVTGTHSRFIHRFDGNRFTAVVPYVPGHDESWDWGGWGWGQTHLQDHEGEWWFATWFGLFRYPKVSKLEDLAHTPPKVIYTPRDGLGGDSIFRLYEDSRGDIWISAWGQHGLTRWDRATGRFRLIVKETGWDCVATAIREDRYGNIWLGMWEHDLARYRQGKVEVLRRDDGFPDGMVNAILLDHVGRIWAGSSRGGMVRIDEPNSDPIRFRIYSTKNGLSSNNVRAITEDQWGRIYFWTGRGVDRLEPDTGGVVHYTTADGLVPAGSDNQTAFADRHGNLWFGYVGLSRFVPQPEPTDAPSFPIYIRRVRARGVPLPISELGETNLTGLVLQPSQNNLQIEFESLNFDMREVLRYQYKLEGTDKDWSPPTDVRAVNYADLRPGNYRFSVRAINVKGQVSATPAVVSFKLLAPVWARWWFISLMVGFTALVVYGLYQFRVNQLLEVERVRTRIASDLHDDVGSGLTQIAILSEVVKQDDSSNKGEQLSRIADLSRELVDGMGEIVWAMNPQRDQLSDLVQRMRRFASDVFVARSIDFEFHAPPADLHLPLRSDVRRQIYLIFKEAVNNCVRHSGCTQVSISMVVERGELKLEVSDNGKGIVADENSEARGGGHGLGSMKQRAAEMGGKLEIESSRGEGARIFLRAPVSQHAFRPPAKTT